MNEFGFAAIEKSAALLTDTVTVVECDRDPLVPATVTVYVPGFEELTDRVEEPVPPDERETLAGLSDVLGPAGELVEDRATVPAKLFRLASVIVEVAVAPALTLIEVGLALMLKSGVGEVGLKNSVIGVALPSPVLRLARFQFVSIVLGNE